MKNFSFITMMPLFNHNNSCPIHGNKLRKYKNNHPSFNWNEIECKLPNANIPISNKKSTMKLFENEWFIQDSELSLSFDCRNHTGRLHGKVWEINVQEMFKATDTEQKEVKEALGSIMGVATQKFRYDHPYKDTIQVHMERYSKRLSKRKNDFVDSVLLKNTSPLKRSRTEEVNEETNRKKLLCQYTEQTSLSSTLQQDMSNLEQFDNEYFVESSDSNVCFDTRVLPEICMELVQGGIYSRCWKLEGEILEVNLTELSKATKAEQNQVESALGGIMGEVVETGEVSSIDLHLQRYFERLSKEATL